MTTILEQQLLQLIAASRDDPAYFASSAQSDTELDEDDIGEPFPLASIDEQAERLQQQQQLAVSVAHLATPTLTDRETRRAALRARLAAKKAAPMSGKVDDVVALQKWLDKNDDDKLGHHHPHHHRTDAKLGHSDKRTETEKFLEEEGHLDAAPDGAQVDGLWSWFKGTFLSYTLYPISSSQVPSATREAFQTEGALNLMPANRSDTVTVDVEDGNSDSHKVNIQKVRGVSGAFVYEADFNIYRSEFFKTKHGERGMEAKFVKVTFKHPVSGSTKTMRLQADMGSHGEEMDQVAGTRVWATKPDMSGTSLVLRFSPEGGNPNLQQVIVLFKTPAGASVDAIHDESGLTERELQLAAHVLAGTMVDLSTLHDTHTIANSAAACQATATAICQARAAFAQVDVPRGEGVKAPAATMLLFKQYASTLANLGSQAQASGALNVSSAAQGRGELLAAFIIKQLEGASNAKIVSTLQALGNVAEVLFMRETHDVASNVSARSNMFWAADKKLRADAGGLYEAYYG